MRLIILLGTLLCCTSAFGSRGSDHSVDGYLVQLLPQHSPTDLFHSKNLTDNAGLYLVDTISQVWNIYHLREKGGHTDRKTLSQLQQHPAVKSAQFNHKVEPRAINRDPVTPNDPYYDTQWNLQLIGAPQAWIRAAGSYFGESLPTVIGVLEVKGFDTSHVDLRDNIYRFPNEIQHDQIDNDNNGYIDDHLGWNVRKRSSKHPVDVHGTRVIGIMAARGNNGEGICGVQWNDPVLLVSGMAYESEIIQGYEYLYRQRQLFNESNGQRGLPVLVTNASLGLIGEVDPAEAPLYCGIFDRLGEVGVLSVTAAPNESRNVDLRSDVPTSCSSDYLITVTEIDFRESLSSTAPFGPGTVDIAAPGVGSMSTEAGNAYVELSTGTSYAAPHVAGAIALLYAQPKQQLADNTLQYPARTARQIRDFILDGAHFLPALQGRIRSEGRLDIPNALRLLHHVYPETGEADQQLMVMRMYPNPVRQDLYMQVLRQQSGPLRVLVYNLLGQPVLSQRWDTSASLLEQRRIDVSSLPSGRYFLRLQGDEDLQVQVSFVKL